MKINLKINEETSIISDVKFTVDDTIKIIEETVNNFYATNNSGSYIKYNQEKKVYEYYQDVSYHGSPSYEVTHSYDLNLSRKIREMENFIDLVNNDKNQDN